MASVSNNTTLKCDAYSSNSWRLTATLTENSVGTSAQNTSNVTVTATLTSIQGSFSTGSNNTLEVWFYNNNDVTSGVLVSQQIVQSLNSQASVTATGTFNTPHKDDGTLTGYVIAKWTKAASSGYPPNSGSVNSGTLTFTTIPRDANITSYSVSKRSATSFAVSWGADATCDAVQYRYKTSSSSSYGSWTNASGTSFNIGSLNANTTYNVQIRVRRQDSQLWKESSVATQTTNKLPTQSLNNKTETTIKMNWSSDVTASYIWYTTNGNSSSPTWTQVTTNANATSGSYNITGLTANTTYNIKTRVRRSSNSVDEDTSTLAVTTYKIPTQSLKSKTETSITMNWSADSTISKVEYSTNNGSSYTTATTNANATSGSYTITGLSANTPYNIKTRLTRSATSTNYPTTTLEVKTHQYPFVSAVNKSSLTIGDSQTLTIENPLNRSVTVYMKQTNTSGTTLYSKSSVTGTTLTFTPTASTLYNSIPNSPSGNAVYYCVYLSQNVGAIPGTYKIDNSGGELNPTFTANDWSYSADLTNLTNDDQVVIKGQSTITYSIDTEPTFKYNATLKNYKLEWGTKNSTTTTTSGTVQKGDSATLKVSAIDSRNYYTETLKALGNKYVEYFNPTMTKGATHRDSGVRTDTTLSMEGSVFNQTFGANGVLNEFTSAKYYVSTNNSTWSSAFDIPVSNITYDGNNYTLNGFQIHANGSTDGFVVGQRYYIKVELTDKINTYTFTGITVTDGKLAIDTYQDSNGEYHRGVNGLADSNYALIVYGKLTATEGFDGNISNAEKSDTEKLTLTNPSSDTTYYLPFISGITNNEYYGLKGNNGIKYITKEGTTSAVGKGYLYLGNSTASGTAGNKRGILFLFDNSSYYGAIYGNGNLTANRDYYLPNATGTLALTSSTVAQSDASKLTLSNPSSETLYYIPFLSGITNGSYYGLRGNNGAFYLTKEGTTSANGYGGIIAGNNTASGTAGNKYGLLRLYDTNTYYGTLKANSNLSNNRTLYFPNHNGTVQVRPTNLYNNTSGGSNGTITLSATSANYTYMDIYFRSNDGNAYVAFTRVYSPNGKKPSLIYGHINGSTTTYYKTKQVSISGTSITNIDYGENYMSASVYGWSHSNNIYIIRVDGWV